MAELDILLILGALALLLTVIGALASFRARAVNVSSAVRRGEIWRVAYQLGQTIASGTHDDEDFYALVDYLSTTPDPYLAATAVGVVARERGDLVHEDLFSAAAPRAVVSAIAAQLDATDRLLRLDSLELIESLRLEPLFGDVAVLTRDPDPDIARAAAEAMIAIRPEAGLGLLVSKRIGRREWVGDAIARAVERIEHSDDRVVPLNREFWSQAPSLTQRPLRESAQFDRHAATDAIASLIGGLDSESAATRLATVQALARSIAHPGAQIALAGALGAEDRMTRYAAAACLSDTADGLRVLQRVATTEVDTDAARLAAEMLWFGDYEATADRPEPTLSSIVA